MIFTVSILKGLGMSACKAKASWFPGSRQDYENAVPNDGYCVNGSLL